MPPHTPLTSLFQTLRLSNSILPHVSRSSPILMQCRNFSISQSVEARQGDSKKNKIDPRITLIRYHLQHPQTPRPLRFSRMRGLRHWTIHRAWMLARRKRIEDEEKELHRMYQSMQAANEELRTMDAPGTKDAGRLFRIAQEKKGVFGHGGVPIEYARWQTDTPGREAWNHGWKRY